MMCHRSYSQRHEPRHYMVDARADAIWSDTRVQLQQKQQQKQGQQQPFSTTAKSTSPSEAKLHAANLSDPGCNIPPSIASRVGTNLHLQPKHPLHTIKRKIETYWKARYPTNTMETFDNLPPLVSTHANFDSLLIDMDHVSRSKSDTYYLNNETVLRTHTSAHQSELLSKGYTSFLVSGDVYRRDEIDSSHYPIFHQMEGVKVFMEEELAEAKTEEERVKHVEKDLKESLEGMARELFGDVVRMLYFNIDGYRGLLAE